MRRQPHNEYSGHRVVGVRLSEPITPEIAGASKEAHKPQLYAYHMFDKAHIVMLTEEKLIHLNDGKAILKELRQLEKNGVEKIRWEEGGGMYSGEQYLIRRLGYDIGGRIHLGRSSGDLEAVRRRIEGREYLLKLMKNINHLRDSALQVAEQNLDSVMPGYTHSQHAQPTTLGHQLMAWASALERDFERAVQAYSRVNQSPAGAAIMTGSSFPLNRHRTSELLGFDKVLRNTFDAILNEEVTLDTLMTVSTVHLNLAKWASDINFWFTSESGYIDIPDRFCGTSSIMTQKRNPDSLEYMRGAASVAMGGLVTAFSVQKAASGDTTLDPRYMDYALTESLNLADRHLNWMSELLPALKVNKDRMKYMAGAYWAQATDVAAALVKENNIPWRTAHQIVGILVRFSYERNIKPQDVTPELIKEAAIEYMGESVDISNQTLAKALDPIEFVKARTLYGGPSASECTNRLNDYLDHLNKDNKMIQNIELKLQESAKSLELAIDNLLNS